MDVPADQRPWPNFFIPGAPKAGTTSLHRYLAQHPEIFMSEEKELHFFTRTWEDTEGDEEAMARAEEAYLARFDRGAELPVRGESTPGYLHWPGVAERIHAKVPEARFLVSLRDPIERAHSDHAMMIRQGHDDRSFLEVIQAELSQPAGTERKHIDKGLYDEHLQRYWDVFGQDQVHVVLFEELRNDPLALLHDVAMFLHVDPQGMEQVDHDTVHNPGGQPRNALAQWLLTSEPVHRAARLILPKPWRIWLGDHALIREQEKPPLEPEAVELLVEVYEPVVANLEKMLARDLPELRRTWDV